ncbi:MAG: hypothetical protein DRN04_07645 [Thermoprotei archaeon]|nr:MAG: hypothetical protein DRN04_07645 [Thermoprotei archaeon]
MKNIISKIRNSLLVIKEFKTAPLVIKLQCFCSILLFFSLFTRNRIIILLVLIYYATLEYLDLEVFPKRIKSPNYSKWFKRTAKLNHLLEFILILIAVFTVT